MNTKALLLLAFMLFAAVSTITITVVSNISTPNSNSITKTLANFKGPGNIQPTGGDPVDNPVFPD